MYLNSIDRDGTGNGFDFDILKYIPKDFYKPIIFAGGAGNYKHLLQAFKKKDTFYCDSEFIEFRWRWIARYKVFDF